MKVSTVTPNVVRDSYFCTFVKTFRNTPKNKIPIGFKDLFVFIYFTREINFINSIGNDLFG